jgi:hypothetical protein
LAEAPTGLARRFIISGPLLPEGAISRSQRPDALIVIIVTTVIDNLEIWCLDRLLACSDDGDGNDDEIPP